jgi:hypothetical protein
VGGELQELLFRTIFVFSLRVEIRVSLSLRVNLDERHFGSKLLGFWTLSIVWFSKKKKKPNNTTFWKLDLFPNLAQ